MRDNKFFSHEPVLVSTPASVFSAVLLAPCSLLFDHPIRPRQDVRRYCQSDLLGGLEID
jgi:hypothetical protein